MRLSIIFFINSALLGVGLAMDAFSVSMANGLHEPCMRRSRIFTIAGVFALFQYLMPVTGWFMVRTAAEKFAVFQRFIPWIALFLLCYIGGNMLREGIKEPEADACDISGSGLGVRDLIIQGIATSIDALSVGFTISGYNAYMANISAFIIGAVTFFICVGGVIIGRHFGIRLAGKASILGGIILIAIGLEIFFSNMIK